jgi:oligosaccharide translocation protein RFT1
MNLLIGIYFVAFGPNYSFILLHLLYGSTYSYSAATTVLSWYCLYVLFMGVNGNACIYFLFLKTLGAIIIGSSK